MDRPWRKSGFGSTLCWEWAQAHRYAGRIDTRASNKPLGLTSRPSPYSYSSSVSNGKIFRPITQLRRYLRSWSLSIFFMVWLTDYMKCIWLDLVQRSTWLNSFSYTSNLRSTSMDLSRTWLKLERLVWVLFPNTGRRRLVNCRVEFVGAEVCFGRKEE